MEIENFAAIMTGGSEEKEDSYYRDYLQRATFIIAADSGMNVLSRLGIQPHILLGDMDSIGQEQLKTAQESGISICNFPRDKDKTDTQLALDTAIVEGYRHIHILGGIGSRLDHTLANLYLLIYGKEQGAEVLLINPFHRVQLLYSGRKKTLHGKPGDLVSILPISSELNGLSLRGFHWNLQNATLKQGSSMGISNYLEAETAQIDVQQGMAFIIQVVEK